MNWLLLRGLMRDQRHFAEVPSTLARAIAPGRVVCLDAPGLGTERGRRSPWSVPEIMEDIRGRFGPIRASTAGPWGLFGISLGGMVAMAWSAAHADDFEHVVVANSSATNVGATFERALPSALGTFARVAVTSDPVLRERLILGVSSSTRADDTELARAHARLVPRGHFARDVALAQLRAASRYEAPSRIRAPMTVLCSTRDRLVDSRCSEAIAARFGAELRRHPTAGHDLPLDDGPWLVDQLRSLGGADTERGDAPS